MGLKPTFDPFPLFTPKVGQTQIRPKPAPLSVMNVNTADARQSAPPRFSERTGWPFGLRDGGSVPEPCNSLVNRYFWQTEIFHHSLNGPVITQNAGL